MKNVVYHIKHNSLEDLKIRKEGLVYYISAKGKRFNDRLADRLLEMIGLNATEPLYGFEQSYESGHIAGGLVLDGIDDFVELNELAVMETNRTLQICVNLERHSTGTILHLKTTKDEVVLKANGRDIALYYNDVLLGYTPVPVGFMMVTLVWEEQLVLYVNTTRYLTHSVTPIEDAVFEWGVVGMEFPGQDFLNGRFLSLIGYNSILSAEDIKHNLAQERKRWS